MGKYDLLDSDGLPISKRTRYFDGQFLKDTDFIDEQKYHLDRRMRLTRFTVAAGIAEGLGLVLDRQLTTVTVNPGTAVDAQGHLIVLPSALRVDLRSRVAGEDLMLSISYTERSSDQSLADYGSAGDTRFQELPKVEVHPLDQWAAAAADSSHSRVALGRVVMAQDPADAARVTFTDTSPSTSGRVYAGTTLPSTAGAALTLRHGGDSNPTRAVLGGGLNTGGMELSENLTFTPSLSRQMIGLGKETHGIGVQANTTYFRSSRHFAWYQAGSHHDTDLNPGTGGSSVMMLNNGSLGIGLTPATSFRLHVGGDSKIEGALTFAEGSRQTLNLSGNTHGVGVQHNTTYFRSTGQFGWYSGGTHSSTTLDPGTGGTAVMTLKDGNLGIGITPTGGKRLHVAGELQFDGGVQFNSVNRQAVNLWGSATGMGVQNSTLYYRSANHFAWHKGGSHSDNVVDPGSGGKTLMMLKDENLGIGVSPTSGKRLHVGGDTQLDGSLQFNSVNRQTLNLYGAAHGVGVQGNTTYFRSSGQFGWFKSGVHSDTTLDPGSGGKAIMMLKDENLGIGITPSSGKRLHISGDSQLDGGMTLSGAGVVGGTFNVGGNTTLGGTLSLTGAASLGGALSVGGNLDVLGSIKVATLRADTGSSDTGKFYLEAPSAVDYRASGSSPTTGLSLRLVGNPGDGQSLFQIRSNGQSVRFFVEHNGWTGSADNSAWFGGTRDNYFAGKVGIGTKTPASTLTVNGDLRVSGSLLLSDGNKPFRLVKVSNFQNSAEIPGFSDADWICTVAGWSTRGGDINEGADSGDIMRCYCYVDAGKWRVSADFKSHSDEHESWDVWILAINKRLIQ